MKAETTATILLFQGQSGAAHEAIPKGTPVGKNFPGEATAPLWPHLKTSNLLSFLLSAGKNVKASASSEAGRNR